MNSRTKVNLLPDWYLEKRRERQRVRLRLLLMLALAVLLAGWTSYERREVRGLQIGRAHV